MITISKQRKVLFVGFDLSREEFQKKRNYARRYVMSHVHFLSVLHESHNLTTQKKKN